MIFDCQKCRDYVDLFSKQIYDELKKRNGGISPYKIEDIENELVVTCLKLESDFKYVNSRQPKRSRSFSSYFYEYGKRYALRSLLNHGKDLYAEAVKHKYGEYNFKPIQRLSDKIDELDFIACLMRFALDRIDRIALRMFLDGDESWSEIGRRIGLTHSAVKERLRRLYERFSNWERNPLGGNPRGFFHAFGNNFEIPLANDGG